MLKLLFLAQILQVRISNAQAQDTAADPADLQAVKKLLGANRDSGYTAEKAELHPLPSKFGQAILIYPTLGAALLQLAVAIWGCFADPKEVTPLTKLAGMVGSSSSAVGAVLISSAFIRAFAVRDAKFKGMVGAVVDLVLIYGSFIFQFFGILWSLVYTILISTVAFTPAAFKPVAYAAFSLNIACFITNFSYTVAKHLNAPGLFTIVYERKVGYTRQQCRDLPECGVELVMQTAGGYGYGLGSKPVVESITRMVAILAKSKSSRNWAVETIQKFLTQQHEISTAEKQPLNEEENIMSSLKVKAPGV